MKKNSQIYIHYKSYIQEIDWTQVYLDEENFKKTNHNQIASDKEKNLQSSQKKKMYYIQRNVKMTEDFSPVKKAKLYYKLSNSILLKCRLW